MWQLAQSIIRIGCRSSCPNKASRSFCKTKIILDLSFHPDLPRQKWTTSGFLRRGLVRAQAGRTRSLARKMCALVGATLRLLTLRSGESHALPATLLALFWNTPGRSSCDALLFFLRHSSMRLMLRSDLQHVLDARLLGFSWSFNTLSWYCSRRFLLELATRSWCYALDFLLELPAFSGC